MIFPVKPGVPNPLGRAPFPSPVGHAGKILISNGEAWVWQAMAAGNMDGGIFDPGGTSGTAFNFDGGVY